MASSDPTYARLFELWTPENRGRKWRLRLVNGGIVVMTEMLAREDGQARSGIGKVARVIRPAPDQTWKPGDEASFDLTQIKDVADQDLGAMVFPPGKSSAPTAKPAQPVRPAGPARSARPPRPKPASRSGNRIGDKVATAAILAFALWILWDGVSNWWAWRARRSWPTAPAVLTRAYVEPRMLTYPGGATATVYVPILLYRYQVGERTYQGTELSLDFVPEKRKAVLIYRLLPYREIDSVRIHYDPAKPERAVLEREGLGAGIGLLWLLPVLLVAAHMTWRGMFFAKRAPKQPLAPPAGGVGASAARPN